MALDFYDWISATAPNTLVESKGVTPDRIKDGKISFFRGEEQWVATGWEWIPRFKNKVESAHYHKAISEVEMTIGKIEKNSDKAKGVLLLTVNRTSGHKKTLTIGKFVTSDKEPSKIDNQEMDSIGFVRRSEKGGQFSQLTSNHFIEGASKINLHTKIGSSNAEPHFVFSGEGALETLMSRILSNMKNSKYSLLSNSVVIKATKKFLEGKAVHFDWSQIGDLMSVEDRRKFGIYLVSELSYPFHVWTGGAIDGFPGFKKCRYFCVPASSTEGSYDSYLIGELKEGGIGKLKVSSKSSAEKGGRKGARSSILPLLSNIANSLSDYKGIQNKFLRHLLPFFKDKPARGGVTIYPFAVYDCLKISKSDIPDAVDMWQRICKVYKGNTLAPAIMKKTEQEVNVVFKALKSKGGLPLPGINQLFPIASFKTAAKYFGKSELHGADWKNFSHLMSDIFCDGIAVGLNSDGAADLKPSISWQVELVNELFITTGQVHFKAKMPNSQDVKGIVVDTGKQSAGDPTRNITWLGTRPL